MVGIYFRKTGAREKRGAAEDECVAYAGFTEMNYTQAAG